MGGLILVLVVVALIFAVAYGLFTRQGSGINQHPTPDSTDPVIGDPTKSKGEDEHETEIGAGTDQSEGSTMDQRGTR
jgi:hypothetical protein